MDTPDAVRSVLMITPSSSSGKAIYQFLRPSTSSPIPLLLTPAQEDDSDYDRSCSDCMDILGGLYVRGIPIVTKKILLHLRPQDLLSCLIVSSTWNECVTSHPTIVERIFIFRRLYRAENTSKEHVAPLSVPPKPLRRQVLSRLENICTELPPPSTAPSSLPRNFKYRPCPQCCSPAKELNLSRAECTRCQYDFCQFCFNPWHEVRNCARDLATHKRLSIDIVGSKKSKKRLRRL